MNRAVDTFGIGTHTFLFGISIVRPRRKPVTKFTHGYNS